MNVWVVYHADIEDDKYIRGIYATPRLAEEALALPEVRSFPGGRWSEARTVARRHDDSCCGVEDWTVFER